MDRAPMGTGPYRFVSHEDDTDFIFERFDEHFNPLDHPVNVPHVPFHKRLEVLVRPEVLSRLAGLEAGEIDTVPGLGFSDVKPFLDDEDFNVFLQPAGAASVHNVYPNLNNPELEDGSPNPFLDVRVRIAANMALNRQAIIDNLLSGTEGAGAVHVQRRHRLPDAGAEEGGHLPLRRGRREGADGRGRLPRRLRDDPAHSRRLGAVGG